MSNEQRHGELAGQKSFLAYEPPIHCPFEEKPPGDIE